MKCFLAQDLTTVRAAPGGVVTQPESSWLDLAGYREVFAWVHVLEMLPTPPLGAAPTIALQSAVAKEESLFTTVLTVTPSAAGVTVASAIPELTTPFSRWLRWQLTPPPGVLGDMTFRIWIVANRAGRRPINRSIITPT